MTTKEVRRAEAPDSVHRTVYVVRPDERGVCTYDSWGIEHAHMTTPMIDIFSVEQPFLQTTVQRCIVRPNSVCEHGWFCTDNREVAVMVDKLRKERAAVVAWLREGLTQLGQQTRLVSLGALLSDMVGVIERGEHRREEGA